MANFCSVILWYFVHLRQAHSWWFEEKVEVSDLLSNIPYNSQSIDLSYKRLQYIPNDTFINYTNCVELDLQRNSLDLGVNSFKGLTRLKHLNLRFNFLEIIPSFSFQHLPQLESINLQENRIKNIYADAFVDLQQLKILKLDKNEIEMFEMNAFRGLDNLHILNITYNGHEINVISDNLFEPLKSCEEIHLKWSGINSFQPKVFHGLANLKVLDIQGNFLKLIPNYAFVDLTECKELYLSASHARLKPFALRSLVSLQKLYLDRNREITSLKDFMFIDLKKCESIKLQNCKIKTIEKNAFRGLFKLNHLDLSENLLSQIQGDTWKNLKSLERIMLYRNKLELLTNRSFENLNNLAGAFYLHSNQIVSIEEGTFVRMQNITKLDLSANKIRHVMKGTFIGLENLLELNLFMNEIQIIDKGSFNHLKELKELDLWGNNLTLISRSLFSGLHSLQHLTLDRNRLYAVNADTFTDLFELRHITFLGNHIQELHLRLFENMTKLVSLRLNQNSISHIRQDVFTGLHNLIYVNLNKNVTAIIDHGAFKHLVNVTYLDLSYNHLGFLDDGVLKGLVSLKQLILSNNQIQSIGSGALEHLTSERFFHEAVEVDLRNNQLSDISWNIYGSQFNNLESNFSELITNQICIQSKENPLTCGRPLCWMVQMNWSFCDDQRDSVNYDCKQNLTDSCPSTELCMECDPPLCTKLCQSYGYGFGNLIIDNEVCSFEFFCNCSCGELDAKTCQQNCTSVGKILKTGTGNKVGCEVCACQCPKPNCRATCTPYQFQFVNNSYGCTKCRCKCPDVNCNAQCGAHRVLTVHDNRTGCVTCGRCQNISQVHPKSLSRLTVIIVPSVLCFGLASLSCGIILCVCRRKQMKQNTESREANEEGETPKEILLKNVNSDLAKEIEECWIDPEMLSINNLLGRGNFGTVWSGKLQNGSQELLEVAVKKVIAEYKDVWKVKNRWTKSHELKAQFEKGRKELEMDAQIVEDFLQEAVTMRNFNHPNVLSLIGVSLHNNKPCVILPLMKNGDLKNYLNQHASTLSVEILLSFAIGIAKGMNHLAEQKIVHCDLAARNCMLDENLLVKVSDFGLTKDVYERDYYRAEDESKPLPIRWMSLEAIQFSKFTTQSDVWSYGVVLWEIFSYGGHPYEGLDNRDIGSYLKAGGRLAKPPVAPKYVYDLMQQCWCVDPSKRPLFKDILGRLQGMDIKQCMMPMSIEVLSPGAFSD